jgi:hypothetical protein
MKNVVLASMLAVAGVVMVGEGAYAQTPVNLGNSAAAPAQSPGAPAAASDPCAVSSGPAAPALGTGAPAGNVQMSQDEYAAYNNAVTQTAPAAKAQAFDAYLKAYPKSAVKADALQQEMFAYSQANDAVNTQATADALLAIAPCNLYALVFEVSLRSAAAAQLTDPAAKLAGLDMAASFAVKGLAAPKPKDMSEADFGKLKAQGYPVFHSAIGADDLQKKDMPDAIKAYQAELAAVPVAQTEAPGPQLMDTYYLASAYYQEATPDYLNCAYYAARASDYAPEPFKTTFGKLGTYCYTKFHGKADGYDTATAAAKDSLTPPATYASAITPAPKPADYAAQVVATTPDLAVLALSDKEFVLQYGTKLDPNTGTVDPATGKMDPKTQKTDADAVFDSVKGKSVEIPDAIVVAATADQLQLAVSGDSQQANPPVADFTFAMTTPLTKIPAVGDKVTVDGTYASYTQSPLMITMSDGSIVEPKKAPAKKAPVHHTTHH